MRERNKSDKKGLISPGIVFLIPIAMAMFLAGSFISLLMYGNIKFSFVMLFIGLLLAGLEIIRRANEVQNVRIYPTLKKLRDLFFGDFYDNY